MSSTGTEKRVASRTEDKRSGNAIFVYFDGACGPVNPGGRAGFGWVAYRGTLKIGAMHGYVGQGRGMTNNLAEYRAVIDAMKWIDREHPTENVVFLGDSKLVIEQMNQRWRIKAGSYADSAIEARKIKAGRKHPTRWWFEWIPREMNGEADELSKRGIA